MDFKHLPELTNWMNEWIQCDNNDDDFCEWGKLSDVHVNQEKENWNFRYDNFKFPFLSSATCRRQEAAPCWLICKISFSIPTAAWQNFFSECFSRHFISPSVIIP